MTLCLNTVLRIAKMDISRKMFKKGGTQCGIYWCFSNTTKNVILLFSRETITLCSLEYQF